VYHSTLGLRVLKKEKEVHLAGPARERQRVEQLLDLIRTPRLGSGCRVQGSGFRVQGAGFRVQGSGFRVQGSGFRVHACCCKKAYASRRARIPAPLPAICEEGSYVRLVDCCITQLQA